MKKIKIYTLLLVLTACLFNQLNAAERIEGAFGLKFGDVFDVKKAKGEVLLIGNNKAYYFSPQNPINGIAEYYAAITPKTHKVAAIVAVGKFSSELRGFGAANVLIPILEKKYGSGTFRDSKFSLSQGLRDISIDVDREKDDTATLMIQYTDSDMMDMAEKERIEIEQEKINTGGL